MHKDYRGKDKNIFAVYPSVSSTWGWALYTLYIMYKVQSSEKMLKKYFLQCTWGCKAPEGEHFVRYT